MMWNAERCTDETMSIVSHLVEICVKNGGPVSSEIGFLFANGLYREVAEFVFNYEFVDHASVDDFFYARQIQALLSKQDFLDLGVDRESVALSKFLTSEEECYATNERLIDFRCSADADVRNVFHIARRKISKILGPTPSIDSLDFSFTSGANSNVPMRIASSRTKLSASLECSKDLLPVAADLLMELPNFTLSQAVESRLQIKVAAGRLVFVPKSWKTLRSIVVEPTLNTLYQKGVGRAIRERLLWDGLDLSRQEPNQKLAYQGSVDGTLATLDLKAASDSISYMLVLELLPFDWFCLLENGRTSTVLVGDRYIELEKFSSMGNAYTFELETLIFWALAHGVCDYLSIDRSNVRVFGDDIVVPVDAVELLVKVLGYAGFSLNPDKSFVNGPFRESCGADYLSGYDVRPFYLDSLISDQTLFIMHNWFRRSGENELADACLSYVHNHNRIFGPDGYGDGHLIGTWHARSNRTLKRRGYEGGFFDTFVSRPKLFKKKLPGDWLYPAYSIYAKSIGSATDPVKDNLFPDGRPLSRVDEKGCVSSDDDEMYVVSGSSGYVRISVYTLADTVYRRRV